MAEALIPAHNPLSSKLSQVLGSSYTDYGVRQALGSLEDNFTENTPTSRRHLRATFELIDIEKTGALLTQYEQIISSLSHLKVHVDNVQRSCEVMQAHIKSASAQISRSITDADLLQSRREQIGTKHAMLSSFQRCFTLPEEQIMLLTSTSEPLDSRFFEAFDHAKSIHSSCQSLLTTENNRAGIEIMEQMNRHIDFGFQKLFQWTQKLFKSLQYDSPEINSLARRAIRTLAERPTLFQKCLDSFSEIRRKVVVEDFLEALTQGENALSARAIEIQAHDPLRYLGDILAWTHQAVAGEKEILTLIFGVAASSRSSDLEPGSERWLEDGTILSALEDLIEKDLEGTIRPIRSRIEHLITSQENPTVIFRISMLLKFYRTTLARMLNDSAQLVAVISNLETYSMRQFRLLMAEKTHSAAFVIDDDLGPPAAFLDAISDLRIILTAYESSLSPIAQTGEEITAVLDSALRPYLERCKQLSVSLSSLSRCTVLFNCYDLAKVYLHCLVTEQQMTLQLYSSARHELAALQEKIKAIEDQLLAEQHEYFLESSGLRPFLTTLKDRNEQIPLSREVQFSVENLDALSRSLEEFLPNTLMDAQSRLQKLSSSRAVNTLTQAGASLFIADFVLVEEAVRTHIELSQTVFPRSVDEVKLLLGF